MKPNLRVPLLLLLCLFAQPTLATNCKDRELVSKDGEIRLKIEEVRFNRHLWCFVRDAKPDGVRTGSGFSLPPMALRGFDSPTPNKEVFTERTGIICTRDLDSTVLVKATYEGKHVFIEDRWIDGSPYRTSRWTTDPSRLQSKEDLQSSGVKWSGSASLDEFNGLPYSVDFEIGHEFQGRGNFVLKIACRGNK